MVIFYHVLKICQYLYFKLLYKKEIFWKGGCYPMTSADLIWRLIEIIFKDKESNENAKEQEK